MTHRLSNHTAAKWLHTGTGPIIATRARLARNDQNYPFPQAMTADQARRWCRKQAAALEKQLLWGDALLINSRSTPEQRQALTIAIEEHLASPTLAALPRMRGLLANDQRNLAVMLLEEDHYRIQSYHGGLQAAAAAATVHELATAIAEIGNFAVDSQFGYLTACPTNAGTGLRLSAFLHVPALIAAGFDQQLTAACKGLRMLVRGTQGEGSKPIGRLIQVSNAGCFGQDEEQLQKEFSTAIQAIAEFEIAAREQWRRNEASLLTDLGAEAVEQLRSGQAIKKDHALSALSRWRLAGELELLPFNHEKWALAYLATGPQHARLILGYDEDNGLKNEDLQGLALAGVMHG